MVSKTDEYLGYSHLLGGRARLPPKVYAYGRPPSFSRLWTITVRVCTVHAYCNVAEHLYSAPSRLLLRGLFSLACMIPKVIMNEFVQPVGLYYLLTCIVYSLACIFVVM